MVDKIAFLIGYAVMVFGGLAFALYLVCEWLDKALSYFGVLNEFRKWLFSRNGEIE